MAKFAAISILEVWDFRLSKGAPTLYCDGEFWRVEVCANDGSGVLAEHTTDVKTNGDPNDVDGINACYKWLKSVRDKFSRDNIELRKPVTKMINEANHEAAMINTAADAAAQAGESDKALALRGELQAHLTRQNARIKQATAEMHVAIAAGGA